MRAGVQQLIYASSGSVYGVKDELDVTEDLELVPISVYNKTKMVSERVTLSYKDSIKIHNIRPATVCGWSPRMRLDVSVNMLTFQALKNKKDYSVWRESGASKYSYAGYDWSIQSFFRASE